MKEDQAQRLRDGIQFLAEAGLNLFTVFACDQLPESMRRIMLDNGVPLDQYGRLVLTAHGGKTMWSQLQARGMTAADPVDNYSCALTQQFITDYLDDDNSLFIYPAYYLLPLQKLGQLAGWSHPSPLGSGINETYGLWFAYRSAFLTNAALPVTLPVHSTSPCDTCQDKPCLTACPVGATQEDGRFRLDPCAHFRLSQDSPCAGRCLARMACPIAPEHQYSLPQIQYHYGQSLPVIRQYYKG